MKPLVDYMKEQIINEVLILSGKEKQVSFSLQTWQLANALYSRSPANFREQKELSPVHLPSESSMKKVQSQNRVDDGRVTTAFEKRQASNLANGICE